MTKKPVNIEGISFISYLVVKIEDLVVKMGHLVVIFEDLVVKIMNLVVIVK